MRQRCETEQKTRGGSLREPSVERVQGIPGSRSQRLRGRMFVKFLRLRSLLALLVVTTLVFPLAGQPPCDTPAMARDDAASVTAGEIVIIDILANDSDAGGEPLMLNGALGTTGCSSLGTAAFNSDGTVTFTAFPEVAGSCSLSYSLVGGGSAQVQVMVANGVVDTDGCDGVGDTSQDPFGYSSLPATTNCLNGSQSIEACCWKELIRGLRGQKVCTRVTQRRAADPATVLFSGGSENHSVLCQAAQYLETGNDAWYLDYMSAQEGFDLSQNLHGWMGTEVLSPLYGSWIVASNLAVLAKARESSPPDLELASRLEDWLLKYWVMQALLANDFPISQSIAEIQNGPRSVIPEASFWDGLSVASAGARRLSDDLAAGLGYTQPAHFLTALALDYHPRNLGSTHLGLNHDNNAEHYYMGLRVPLLLEGLDFFPGQNGTADFESFHPPASLFGLTESQQETLRLFVESRGNQDPAVILDLLPANPIPHCEGGASSRCCEMTFLRTTEGTMGYFGAGSFGHQSGPLGRQYICNWNKPPLHAVRMDLDGTFTLLAPGLVSNSNTPHSDYTYESGNQVCAKTSETPSGDLCLTKPGGAVIYKITWTAAEGLVVRDYNPQGGGPPAAPAILAQPAALGVLEGDGATFQVRARSVPPGRGLDYRWYKDGIALPLGSPGLLGVDSPTLQISATIPSDAGSYHCRVTDRAEPTLFSDSLPATLAVTPDGPALAILTHPATQNKNEGEAAVFSITAQGPTGPAGLRYRWQRGGVDLVSTATGDYLGADSPTLTIVNLHNSMEGDFRCLVWDVAAPSQVLASNTAPLSVFEPRAPFGGSPRAIPGTLQVEHYDEGEPGAVYFDTTPEDLGANRGNWEVRRDPVDFLTGAGQAQVRLAYTAPGEFLKYTVDITQGGPFELTMNYRMIEGPGEVDLTLGAETVTLLLNPQAGFSSETFVGLFTNAVAGPSELILAIRQAVHTSAGLQINWLRFASPPPPLPDPPIAHDDPDPLATPSHLNALKDQDLVIDLCSTLLGNDEGFGDEMPCGSGTRPVLLEDVTQPAEGQVILGVDQLIYRPAPGYSGPDSFQYSVRDSAGQVSATVATVSLFVAANQPVAFDDSFTSLPQTPAGDRVLRIYKGTLTNNDVAAHGQPIFSSLVESPAPTADISDPGSEFSYLNFVPPPGVTQASLSFQYRIRDSYVLGQGLESVPATVTIQVTDLAPQPIANPDVFVLSESRTGDRTGIDIPLARLTDNDHGSGNFEVLFPPDLNPPFGGPPPGTGDFQPRVSGFIFQPAPGFTGTTAFPYRVDDRSTFSLSEPADVTLRVVPFPVAVGDTGFVTVHNAALVIPAAALFANDEHHGLPLTALLDLSVPPTRGTVTLLASGDFLYTPSAGEAGFDSFSYKVRDDLHSVDPNEIHFGGKADRISGPATVTVQILPPAPQTVDDHYLMPASEPELLIHWDDLVANDSPPGAVQLTEFYSPQYGTTEQLTFGPGGPEQLTTRYVPGAGLWQTGGDSFQYRIERLDRTPPDTALGTVHLTPLQVVNPWITDGFETAELGPWDATSALGGTLEVAAKAALNGSFGLSVEVDPAGTGVDPGSILVGVSKDFETPQSHLWLDFMVRLHPNLLQVDPGDSFQLVNTYLAGEGHIELKARAKALPAVGFELQAVTYQDAGAAAPFVRTAWVDAGIEDRWVTLEWRASRAPGADDGALRLWLDRRLVDEKTGLDNDRKTISRIRLGAVKGIDPGTAGSIFYDQISLWPGTNNRETLLQDDFEAPLPGPWDRVTVYGGTLETAATAALSGSSGLALHIDPVGTGIPASSAVLHLEETFAEPQNHLFVEFQLQIDAATFQMPEGADFVLLPSYYAGEGHLEVRLRRSGGQYQLQATTYQDPGAVPGARATPWVPLGTAAHWITLEWLAASLPGADDGALRLWIDHQLQASILAVDNDQKTISRLRLGAVSRVDEGTSGRIFFDNVTYWRGQSGRRNLLADNFENGDLGAWAMTTGSVSATSAASLLGAYGLEATLAGAGSAAFVTDDSPDAATTYQARFLLDTGSLTLGAADRFVLLKGSTSSGLPVFEIKVDGGGGAPRIRPVMFGDTNAAPAWIPLSSGSQEVRFAWQATSAGGLARFWIDGVLTSTSAYDSGSRTVDTIELGAVRAVDAGTTGTLAIDEFRSWE